MSTIIYWMYFNGLILQLLFFIQLQNTKLTFGKVANCSCKRENSNLKQGYNNTCQFMIKVIIKSRLFKKQPMKP